MVAQERVAAIVNLECSPEFIERNFAPSEYADAAGRKLPSYCITRELESFAMAATQIWGSSSEGKRGVVGCVNGCRQGQQKGGTDAAHGGNVAGSDRAS